jgi:hypothetical protein
LWYEDFSQTTDDEAHELLARVENKRTAASKNERREMMDETITTLTEAFARPLTGAKEDYDPLLEMIGDARFVLLGEASHGTHEFYRERGNSRSSSRSESAALRMTAVVSIPAEFFRRWIPAVTNRNSLRDFARDSPLKISLVPRRSFGSIFSTA